MRSGQDATTMRPHRALKASVLALAAGLFAAGPAAAGESYVGVHGGLNYIHEYGVRDPSSVSGSGGSGATEEIGYAVGLTAGYAFESNFRLELETTYREFDIGSNLAPYAGFGLGVGFFDDGSTVSDTGKAFQLGAGIGYAVTDSLTASVDYRFLYAVTGYRFIGTPDRDLTSNSLWFGLRHGF